MGVNFPTAFWKGSNPSDDGEVSIDWDLKLYYSKQELDENGQSTTPYLGAENAIKATQDSNGFFPDIEDAHPYVVGTQNYFFEYAYTSPILAPDSNSFFGWLLTGYNQNDLQGFHRANPFIVEDDGKELNLFFEADQDTLEVLGRDTNYSTETNTRAYENTFNRFIQSGYAEGSFTLNSTSSLSITVSGLGETYNAAFDKMHLAVNGIHICKGQAPGGNDSADGWDMNQVKLFNSAGVQTPTQYANRDGGAYVDQDNRRFGYTTAAGQATFTTPANPLENMEAGVQHTIKIYFNTNDGIYNSGAFYGFKFNFS
tara:strand:- start:88 stop:1026 length:939 start_codon:yes stop_codon:yes gene_type:complete